MKKALACMCCAALILSMSAVSLSAFAAETDAVPVAATVEIASSGETLNSQGLSYELGYDHTASVTGFSQKVYAAQGNTNYNTNHKLIIPSEVEGNKGEKYKVTKVYITDWKEGKDANTFETLVIPKTVSSLGGFKGINSLKYVDFEKGSEMTIICGTCFEDCANLIRIGVGSTDKLPDGISYLEWSAFKGCKSLKEIKIPASVRSVGLDSFKNCTGLEKVIFEVYHEGTNKGKSELVNLSGSAFSGCTSLTHVELPVPIGSYSISVSCFENTSLTSITVPEGVTSIDGGAFQDTPLKGINLPSTCSSVRRSAFAGTKLNENGLKTPDGKAYGIAFVCKTVSIDDNAFGTTDTDKESNRNTIIAGYDNSNANSYAIEQDMKFISLGDWNPCKVTYKGDIDDDGEADQRDVARLIQYVNGWRDIQVNEDSCDVDGDGEITLLDVARLKQYINGWDVQIN